MIVNKKKLFLITAALGAVVIVGCSGKTAKNNTNVHAIPVAVSVVQLGDLTLTRAYNGSLEGIRQAEPTAKLPETITALRASEGDRVSVGQVLIEFDKFGPSSRLHQAEAVFLDAQRNYEKYQRLYEGKAVSERERDYAETSYKVAKADYEAARDQVEVKSPITGVLTDINVKAGQQAIPGQVLAVIAQVDTMRLTCDIPYFDAQPIKKGAPVHLRSELDTSLTAEGWVRKIAESADPATRTVTVEILIANPQGTLRPGMYVTGEILLERLAQVLIAPAAALVIRAGRHGVFVARDSVVHFMPVQTGMVVGDRVEITSGIAAGDQVVVLGQQSLQDSTRVNAEIVP